MDPSVKVFLVRSKTHHGWFGFYDRHADVIVVVHPQDPEKCYKCKEKHCDRKGMTWEEGFFSTLNHEISHAKNRNVYFALIASVIAGMVVGVAWMYVDTAAIWFLASHVLASAVATISFFKLDEWYAKRNGEKYKEGIREDLWKKVKDRGTGTGRNSTMASVRASIEEMYVPSAWKVLRGFFRRKRTESGSG